MPGPVQREEDPGVLGLLSGAVDTVTGAVGGAVGTVTGAVGGAVDTVTGAVGGAVGTVTGAVGSVLGGALPGLGGGDPAALSPLAAALAGLDPSTAAMLQANMSAAQILDLVGRYGLAGLKAIADLVVRFGAAAVDTISFIVRCGLGLPLRLVITAVRFALDPSATSFSEFKPFINIACDCLPPSILVLLVEHTRMAGEPVAQAHLEHYLHGGGADFSEDVASFISRDGGGKAAIEKQVNEQGAAQSPGGKGFSGQAFVMQGDYSLQEYLDAWGNVCCIPADAGDEPGAFFFQVLDDPASRTANLASANARVRLSMRDHYKWHPDEPRPTQCLHQMLEAQKAGGAKEYFEVGSAVVDLTIDPALLPI